MSMVLDVSIYYSVVGPVAQRLEQGTHNPLVPGSNPGGPILWPTRRSLGVAESLSFVNPVCCRLGKCPRRHLKAGGDDGLVASPHRGVKSKEEHKSDKA